MAVNLTTLTGDIYMPDLVREAAHRSLQIEAKIDMAVETETPFGTGRVSIQEVQPGLRSELVALQCHTDLDFEVVSDPMVTCSLTLEEKNELVSIEGLGTVEYPVGQATLVGLGARTRWVRHIRADRQLKAYGFTIEPEFFAQFASVVDDEQLAVFEPYRTGQSCMRLPVSQRLLQLGRNAFERPYHGVLDAIYHESNTLQFMLEVASLLSEKNELLQVMGKKHYDRLMHARAILDENLIHPPKTLDLAREVGTNINTLQRHFKMAFDTTIFGYLRSRRLEMARVLITEHGLASKETGYRVGFSNPAAFTAAYRRYFGHPPSAE